MKKLVLSLVTLLCTVFAYGQHEEYSREVYRGKDGGELNYRLLLPDNFDEKGSYPLVLFLHGAGERGEDNAKQLTHGGAMFTNPVNREKYPAVVVFPQCPTEQWWIGERRPTGEVMPMSEPLQLVEELVNDIILTLPVDARRVYVMGLSMGGMGTFDIVSRNPDMFAAAVPICGAATDSMLTSELKGTKFRLYHGDADNVVYYENSRHAYRALKEAGVSVEYIEFPGVNHDSWTSAFNQPDFLEWVFKQKRKR